MLGPAFVAAIAYVDPGNVATNLTAGAPLGYTLVWVVVLFLLVGFCRDRTLMGPLMNAPLTTAIAADAGTVVALPACSLPLTPLG